MAEGDPREKRVPNRQEGGFGHWSSTTYVTPEGSIKECPVWNQDTPRTSGPEAGMPVGGNGSQEPNAQRLGHPLPEVEYDDNGYPVRRRRA